MTTSTAPDATSLRAAAEMAAVALGQVEPNDLPEATTRHLRTLLFRGAGVDAETVRELIPVYDALVDELNAYAETILTAPPEDRARVSMGDIEILKQTRAHLERQRTRRVPPEPALLRAAARRLAGVAPPKIPPLGSYPEGERRVLTAYFSGQVLLDERNTTLLA